MEAIAHNKAFAKKVGVPQSVGRDFSNADKGKTFKKGGDTMASKMDPKMMAVMKKARNPRMPVGGRMAADNQPMSGMGGMSQPGTPAMMKKGGMAKKMAKGGMAKEDTKMDKSQDKAMIKKAFGMHDKQEHKGEHTNLSKLKKGGMTKMAAGGSFRSSANGVASKGKTKGTMIKMAKGGKYC